MRYYVTIEGTEHVVELGPDGVRIDGDPVDAELAAAAGSPVRHLLLDGRSYRLSAEHQGDGQWSLHHDGFRVEAHVLDERTRAIREMTASAAPQAAAKPLKAPMPGLIVRIEVEPGVHVTPGQGLVIIEAMKMENELRAEAVGCVASVRVAAGQAVEKGQVLIEFQSAEGGA